MPNNGIWSVERVVAAGAAGGAAEVLWISGAAAVLGVEGSHIARAVTGTVVPVAADTAWAPWLGLAIHFLLSFALAAVFIPLLARRLHRAALITAGVGTLALVWAFNFVVLLPVVNPAFTTLLPYPVTLISKLLFGLAMTLTLVHAPSSSTTRPISLRIRG